jgi:3-oxoacyl-[acyl-carrier-protein] synthase II
MKRRVVISGASVVTALGCQLDEFWDGVCAGKSGIGPIRRFDARDYKVRFAGELSDFDAADHINMSGKDLKRLDRFSQFAIVAADHAIRNSGIDFTLGDPYRNGVLIGSGIGGLHEIEVNHEKLFDRGPSRVSAFMIPKLMVNAASGHVSIRYGLRGPNYAVATACASATNAMGDAFKAIQYDDAEVMITGGTEAACTPMGLSGFANMRALSERHDDPAGASRPFDMDRDGFVLSEGAGLLVFEELEHAKKRGARIYAEVLGYGASADGGHITQPDAEGVGAAKAMSGALRDAKLNADQVDYINAHGTSTPLGDKAETYAVKTVFGDHAYKLSVSSTKSSLGHLLGASGGVEMVLCMKALEHGICPPTINYTTPDPACNLDYTPNTPRERKLRIVMSNSFGFGGHNASIIAGAA